MSVEITEFQAFLITSFFVIGIGILINIKEYTMFKNLKFSERIFGYGTAFEVLGMLLLLVTLNGEFRWIVVT